MRKAVLGTWTILYSAGLSSASTVCLNIFQKRSVKLFAYLSLTNAFYTMQQDNSFVFSIHLYSDDFKSLREKKTNIGKSIKIRIFFFLNQNLTDNY